MIRIVKTKDGSSTLFSENHKEHYHSLHGAVQESLHVFIKSGLDSVLGGKDSVSVFEVGFGTGLNAFLTYFFKGNARVYYAAIDTVVLNKDIIDFLNYPDVVGGPSAKSVFMQMHEVSWDKDHTLIDGFILNKINKDIKFYETQHRFDVVYFDAFSYDSQPELWSKEIFSKMYGLLKENGILVTYSAKGEVRRIMKECGFIVEKIPGPMGKREMLRALKPRQTP